jgi:hypothetical protein
MNDTSKLHYGELQSEKLAEENRIAREIVKEINNFGINERQRWLIMYILSMELENVDDLKKMTTFIRETKGDNIFLMSSEEMNDG